MISPAQAGHYGRPVAIFVIELYVSRTDKGAVRRAADRSQLAAQELTLEEVPVRYLRSMFVPEDETCFMLYEAASADAVREVARRADLVFERVAEATVAESIREENHQ